MPRTIPPPRPTRTQDARAARGRRAGRIEIALLLAIGAAGSIACSPASVVRVIDGREIAGRYVSERAYALYARGADAEARGDLEGARIDYLAAGELDEDSAEVWTRIGAVSCALGRADDARDAFDKAASGDPGYEPLHRERARCDLAGARPGDASARAALDEAARSLALDPDSEEGALLYARAAEIAGDPVKAERVLRELVVREPGRAAAWRALLDFAERRSDAPLRARAASALAGLSRDAGTSAFPPGPTSPIGAAPSTSAAARDVNDTTSAAGAASLADVDAAVASGAIDLARAVAKRARLAPADLAVRAAALGKAALAKTQAELVFKADPTNASAAIALAVACDLLHDDAGIATAFADPAALTTPPSPLARALLVELLLRRADREAAAAYAGSLPPAPADADDLLRTVTDRARAAVRK